MYSLGYDLKMQLFILLTLLKGLIIFESLISEGEWTTDTNRICSYQLQQLIQCWGFDGVQSYIKCVTSLPHPVF